MKAPDNSFNKRQKLKAPMKSFFTHKNFKVLFETFIEAVKLQAPKIFM